MAARAALKFQDVFEEFLRACNFTPATVLADASQSAKRLDEFHRAWRRGYNFRKWEDAWQADTFTPVSRLIAWSEIDDSRLYEAWTADPRDPANCAREVDSTPTIDGILLDCNLSSVFILWLPDTPKFTTTAYAGGTTYAAGALVLATDGNVYRSLQGSNTGHEPSASADWWRVVPFLALLQDFTVAFAAGCYHLDNGYEQKGGTRRSDALTELEPLAIRERARWKSQPWNPNRCR